MQPHQFIERPTISNRQTNTTIFLDVTECILVEVYRRFRGIHCLHHQGTLVSKVGNHQQTKKNNQNQLRPDVGLQRNPDRNNRSKENIEAEDCSETSWSHDVTSQKTVTFIVTAVRTSNRETNVSLHSAWLFSGTE
jgi:hypothetical protein